MAGDYSGATGAPEWAEDADLDDEQSASGTGAEPDEVLSSEVPLAMGGKRLDATLASMFSRYSRSRLQGWIRGGRVQVDGSTCMDVRFSVRGGERVSVQTATDPSEVPAKAEPVEFPVLYEDAALIIVDKPAGLVVHPACGNWQGTLLNGLLYRFPELSSVPRAGIVHRLDKDTSGLMAVARTVSAQTDLVRQLQARSVKREYRAVVQGRLERSGTVDAPIGRHPTQRTRMAVVSGGKAAVTHYRPITGFASATEVACRLETGRTHQIRVHMAHLGHPLVGDILYGARGGVFARQALHAERLALDHPDSGRRLQWESVLPADIAALLESLNEPA